MLELVRNKNKIKILNENRKKNVKTNPAIILASSTQYIEPEVVKNVFSLCCFSGFTFPWPFSLIPLFSQGGRDNASFFSRSFCHYHTGDEKADFLSTCRMQPGKEYRGGGFF